MHTIVTPAHLAQHNTYQQKEIYLGQDYVNPQFAIYL